jgi:hypothetical protein
MQQRTDRYAMLRKHWLALPLAVAMCAFWSSTITRSEVCCDAYDNLRMAVSLSQQHVMSLDVQAPYQPTMYREPLPPLVTAGIIAVAEQFTGTASLDAYQHGARTAWLKYQNVLWMLLVCAAVYVATWRVVRRVSWSLGMALASQAIFFYPGLRGVDIDTLFTEIPATAILVVASILYANGVQRHSWRLLSLAGAAFGALALVKAAFLPVFAGLVVATPLVWLRVDAGNGWRQRLIALGAMAGAFIVIVGPWMWRNQQLFGTIRISDRGGYSLYTRALKDQKIWPAHYIGAFYAWTPNILKPLVGAVTGYRRADMQAGGVLQQFNRFSYSGFRDQDRRAMFEGRPEAAISYYYQGRAEWEKEKLAFRAAGSPNPELKADQQLTRRALAMIERDPWAHVALIFPMLWRGALLTFPILLVVLTAAIRSRNAWQLAFAMPAFGLIMFYACVSNFEERYGIPAVPIAMILGICWLRAILAKGATAPAY